MKTFLTTALFLAFTLATGTSVLAQAAWEAPLRSQIQQFNLLNDGDDLSYVTATTERIAAANPKAWLPNYYAAHFNLLKHWVAGEKGCEACVEKTDAFLAKAEAAEANNSEVMTLRASYYQAMLQLHPMRAPFYGPKAGALLEAAMAADATNPRAASLMGQNLWYTPSMFGGGMDKAKPYLAKAVALFDAEAADADRSDLLPTWGAGRAKALNAQALASK